MLIMSYDTESKSRNADFILIAREGDTTTLGAKGPVKLKNPWTEGPSILRTFPSEPSEPSEPSRQRRVLEPSRHRRVPPKKTVLPEKWEHCFFCQRL